MTRKRLQLTQAAIDAGATLTRELADRLRAGREYRGFDQAFLAENIGVSRAYISEFERGTRTPCLHDIQRLAMALRVRLAWLVTGEGLMTDEKRSGTELRLMAEQRVASGVDYIGACFSMLRKLALERESWEDGLRATTAAYLASAEAQLPMCDMAFVLDMLAENYGLNLVNILSGLHPGNLTDAFVSEFRHRGIDPQAFKWSKEGGVPGPIRYFPELAADPTAMIQAPEARTHSPVDPGIPAYVEKFIQTFRPSEIIHHQ
jgi:transcriptional regulator with XRE-family HTH domain